LQEKEKTEYKQKSKPPEIQDILYAFVFI